MRYKKLYPAVICFCVFLAAIGLVLGDPSTVLPGLWKIIVTEDALITDYVKIAGVSAALVNSALVTLVSLLLLYLSKEPPNGFTLVELGLMAGFSLFGKNIVNIWPIIAGTFLYAKARREPFGKYVSVSLLATALAPVVSYVALDNGFGNLWWGIAVGLLIGFVLPPLSAYTYKIQNGMNLYNMGFACGLLAMILVPVMSSMGANPTVAHHWAEGYNLHFAIFLGVLCLGLTVAGFFFSGRPAWAAWAGYRRLLRTTGRAPSDYLRMFGPAPVLINMGVNGLIGMAFILATGGDLNGPTLGGILTIMGFSAFGKHARNITPIMLGVVIGGAFGKITTSLVNDIIMPVVSLLTNGIDFSQWKLVLQQAVVTAAGEVQTPEVAINFGNLIAVVLDFLIIAFVIFCMIKAINRLHRKAEEPAPEPAPPEPSAEEKLLTEIRDLLKEAHDAQGTT